MAEFGFTIATKEYDCPRCRAKKGEFCHTPKGRQTQTPHGERTKQMTKEDWDRCKVKAYSFEEVMKQMESKFPELKKRVKEIKNAERKTVVKI